jgi:hypothetical protein
MRGGGYTKKTCDKRDGMREGGKKGDYRSSQLPFLPFLAFSSFLPSFLHGTLSFVLYGFLLSFPSLPPFIILGKEETEGIKKREEKRKGGGGRNGAKEWGEGMRRRNEAKAKAKGRNPHSDEGWSKGDASDAVAAIWSEEGAICMAAAVARTKGLRCKEEARTSHTKSAYGGRGKRDAES